MTEVHKQHRYITQQLCKHLSLKAFCPEVISGMPIPRRPIRLIRNELGIRCVASHDNTIDVTDNLSSVVASNRSQLSSLCGFVVQKDSPSCGLHRVKVYKNGIPKPEGTGIFTAALHSAFPLLPIEDEGRLCDPKLREQFIQEYLLMTVGKYSVAEL